VTRLALGVLIAFLAAAPMAAKVLDAAAFARLTTGRTLTYSENGRAYGRERYLPGRRVIWRFSDGPCRHGRWYPEDGMICFVYETVEGPQCWIFRRESGRITASFEGEGEVLVATEKGAGPMSCPGPEVGV